MKGNRVVLLAVSALLIFFFVFSLQGVVGLGDEETTINIHADTMNVNEQGTSSVVFYPSNFFYYQKNDYGYYSGGIGVADKMFVRIGEVFSLRELLQNPRAKEGIIRLILFVLTYFLFELGATKLFGQGKEKQARGIAAVLALMTAVLMPVQTVFLAGLLPFLIILMAGVFGVAWGVFHYFFRELPTENQNPFYLMFMRLLVVIAGLIFIYFLDMFATTLIEGFLGGV
ncbi:MAG: hypothetical protein H6502_03650 [Candidatus Woesearchaeota archaeon]|nr:MAG: hypothetical protein H6502_03650 [Candidatus Woesearchaeota archaeon]